jgi:hypothetical protein
MIKNLSKNYDSNKKIKQIQNIINFSILIHTPNGDYISRYILCLLTLKKRPLQLTDEAHGSNVNFHKLVLILIEKKKKKKKKKKT